MKQTTQPPTNSVAFNGEVKRKKSVDIRPAGTLLISHELDMENTVNSIEKANIKVDGRTSRFYSNEKEPNNINIEYTRMFIAQDDNHTEHFTITNLVYHL